jgi:predicted negative regulator of RcsB-dependent stress response
VDEYLSEQEQWEWLKARLRENGPWIVAGVAVGALAIGAWRWWQTRTEHIALDAAGQYEQVLRALDQGDRARGLSLLDQLRREHPRSPYVDQGDLAAARALVEANELPGAVDRLREVMQNSRDPELATIARLRLARVQIALGKPDDALATLSPTKAGAFAPRAHEVRGDALLAKGDRAGALREYREAQAGATPSLAGGDLLTLKINDLLGAADSTHAPPGAAAK